MIAKLKVLLFRCRFCGYECKSLAQFLAHMDLRHPGSAPKIDP